MLQKEHEQQPQHQPQQPQHQPQQLQLHDKVEAEDEAGRACNHQMHDKEEAEDESKDEAENLENVALRTGVASKLYFAKKVNLKGANNKVAISSQFQRTPAFSIILRHAVPLGRRRNNSLNLWCTINSQVAQRMVSSCKNVNSRQSRRQSYLRS